MISLVEKQSIESIDSPQTPKQEVKLKCYKTELKSVNFMSYQELFQGFDTIKAITFSYDTSFLNSIMSYFKYGEIILGADFLVQKDTKLNTLLVDVLTNSHEATKLISSHEKLVSMIKTGDVFLITGMNFIVSGSQRKYLQKSLSNKVV